MIRGNKPIPSKVVEGAFPASPIDIPRPDFGLVGAESEYAIRAAELADAKWTEVTEAMSAAQTLGAGNAGMIEALCRVFARWKLSEEQVTRHGPVILATQSGAPMQNPWVSIANKSLEQATRLENELGLSPTQRGRVEKIASVKRKALAADGYLNKRSTG